MNIDLNQRKKPIGLFDSGVGGLTVLKQLQESFPHEDFIYLGDTARTPYGTKGPERVLHYAIESTDFLLTQGVKLIVVACNTVSCVALSELMERYGCPIIGMVEPAVKVACATNTHSIGLIGTRATIRSGAYQRTLKHFKPDISVFEQACPIFVPLVEDGILDGKIVDLAIEHYLADMKIAKPDTLIMACTHYPLLRSALERFMGPNVEMVDCGEATISVVASELSKYNLANVELHQGKIKYFVTDEASRFSEVATQFMDSRDLDITVVKNLSAQSHI